MNKAAFFDVDYVLYKGVIGVDFIEYLCNKKFLEKNILEEIKENYDKLDRTEIDFLEMLENLIFIWARNIKGKRKDTIEMYSRSFIEKNKDKINKKLTMRIENHKKENYIIIGVSASPIEVVSELSNTLGFDSVVATEVEVNNNVYSGQVRKPLLASEGKFKCIKKLEKKYSINLNSSYAYGDSISDLYMLQMVGNPVAVNPKNDLKTIAEKNKWEIINW